MTCAAPPLLRREVCEQPRIRLRRPLRARSPAAGPAQRSRRRFRPESARSSIRVQAARQIPHCRNRECAQRCRRSSARCPPPPAACTPRNSFLRRASGLSCRGAITNVPAASGLSTRKVYSIRSFSIEGGGGADSRRYGRAIPRVSQSRRRREFWESPKRARPWKCPCQRRSLFPELRSGRFRCTGSRGSRSAETIATAATNIRRLCPCTTEAQPGRES